MFSVSTNKARKQRAYSLNRGHGQKQISVSRTQGEFGAFSKDLRLMFQKSAECGKYFQKEIVNFPKKIPFLKRLWYEWK